MDCNSCTISVNNTDRKSKMAITCLNYNEDLFASRLISLAKWHINMQIWT